ncbi:Spermatogenesis-associated protein 1 [Balearica regulorum gibbericeps]|uniref:Spermatogenesis-associated protein 1 n=1 Tax=Balearica regulorum gibbericeps TaxID=100784 RepID=A0A087V9D0_BALRE|nr:Spermatogenesis-associated protein 1 [Balearica regulorum gibbericeps]
MSFSQTRPRTSQLVELHVFYVPEEVWNFKLNTVPVSLTSKFISAGFIRVSPHITLRVLREKLGEYLGGVAVADKFKFLKCIGKKLAVVKAKQETELELESFVPPHALYPELYLLPGVEYFEDVYPLSSSSTQQKHHFNAEANRFGHRSRLSNQNGSSGSLFTPGHSNPADWESGRSDMVFQTSQQNGLSQDQNQHHTPKWNDKAKETAFTLHENHKLTNMENNDHQKDTKLRRDRTQDAGILKIMGDQTTEFVRKNQRCLLKLIIISLENKMVEQLQQTKKDRRHMEKTREELIKKAKGLLEQNKLRRYHVREEWKKKYFETKKATVSLEDALNKLRQDLELYHQKLLLQLEARDSRKQPNNMADSKNYTIIRITTVQHDLDQLRRKLDDTKMKLIIEIKMRKQAAADLRALRAELTQKKIHSALILQSRKSGL